MKRLMLLRHAATAWAENGTDDRDRALTETGHEECIVQAAWMMSHASVPDHALVSAAVRARETWDAMRDRLSPRPPHDVLEDLYLAEPGTLLAHIEALPDTAKTAAVVAHNPGIEVLARMLAGPAPDADAMRAMARGFPTAGIAVFDVNAESWEQVTAVETRLTAFAPPAPHVT
jgi:phosphohistidine phosphatase